MKTKKVKIKDLIIDPKLTSLRKVNPVFVSRYRQAYRSEANMPLIIVQSGTNRIISGNHRATALLQEYDENHTIEVEVRKYASEREVLEDFTKENSHHGNPIDNFTKEKLTRALLDVGCTPENIANLFNISVRKVEILGDGGVAVSVGTKGETEDRPAKKGFVVDEPITEEQYVEHTTKDRGLTVVQQANQLIRWLSQDLIQNTENNFESIAALNEECEKWLVRNPVKVLQEVE